MQPDNSIPGQLVVRALKRTEPTGFSVQGISFSQPAMQQLAIAGETGSGKSSLLKMIAGLLQPDSGEIFFEGKRVRGPLEKLLPGHPRIAYLSQHFELRNNYRVEEELEAANLLPAKAAGRIYEICRINHLFKRRTDQLSGGERQRIVLAKLLTTAPGLLLLDEPFSNLDQQHTRVIKQVLQDLEETLKISCIMVSHDAEDLLSWAHRVLILRDGQIIQDCDPLTLYEKPVDVYAAQLVGDLTVVDDVQAARLWPELTDAVPGRQWMVRPEQLILCDPDEQCLQVMVQKVLYYGSYYKVIARLEDQQFIIHSPTAPVPGVPAGIRLSAKPLWSF